MKTIYYIVFVATKEMYSKLSFEKQKKIHAHAHKYTGNTVNYKGTSGEVNLRDNQ